MGNTKHIYFEGDLKPNVTLTEEEAEELLRGPVMLRATPDFEKAGVHITGFCESCSMVATEGLQLLLSKFSYGRGHLIDLDGSGLQSRPGTHT